MLVNSKSKDTSRVKFISYTGEWPNLCSGVLTLESDGVQYKFGHDYRYMHWHEDVQGWVYEDEDPENPNFDSFWTSGGNVSHDGNYENWDVDTGEWRIDVDDLPEQFRDLAAEIDECMNSHIRWGCCGGCV